MQARIFQCITDVSRTAESILGPNGVAALSDAKMSHVLALRGYLGYGLLQHALQKRHLVEYGVNR